MDYYKRVLIDYEKQVVASLPNPFGSFEKAKYVLTSSHSFNRVIYSFTTTVHNTEDAIKILKDIIRDRVEYQGRCYTIFKEQKGVRIKIYSFNQFINKLNGCFQNREN